MILTFKTIRDFGVLFDNKLMFSPHIDNIISRATCMLGFGLRNIKCFRSCKTEILLYNSLVRVVFWIAAVSFGDHSMQHTSCLQNVHKIDLE